MHLKSFSTILGLLLATAGSSASILRADNTYSVSLSDARGTNAFTGLVFDGRSQYLPRLDRHGNPIVHVMISEDEEDLGDGRHRLSLSLRNPHRTASGHADLFPKAPEESDPWLTTIGLHFGQDPFDFDGPLRLDAAFLRLHVAGELLYEMDIVARLGDRFTSLAPWDGGLFQDRSGIGYAPGRGVGIDHVEWVFEVSSLTAQVPAPTTLALGALGLLALTARTQRARVGG